MQISCWVWEGDGDTSEQFDTRSQAVSAAVFAFDLSDASHAELHSSGLIYYGQRSHIRVYDVNESDD